ncbi:hypothetical protein ATO10_02570 [Actibacterium atlanticum]|uniref:DUF1761 domain-containing protein n=1 Tax=Actibacterium atlanticum TaxID=1461693 RepID=A0A058ZPW1_9RHOB|nr:hypothetical protein [Actibacterium atlanticum]KCV83608.1 hypothetical protein ATO10_02570 [Actibacterium atlanticum]
MAMVLTFVAFFALSLLLGVLWLIVLFKDRYAKTVGPSFSESPYFPLGLTAIAINAAVHISVFSWVYPLGDANWGRAVVIVGTVWGAHFVSTLGTAAKFEIADRAQFVMLELAFSVLNVVVLATLMWVVLGPHLVPVVG